MTSNENDSGVLDRGGQDPIQAAEGLRAAIYARTSSASQEYGYSIDEQVRQCWDRCQQQSWDVAYIFRDEAESGKDADRPMFQRLLTQAENGDLDVVVFWKLDRFSRSLMHAVQLEQEFREWDVALHSVTEQIDTTTPTGRFNFRNISSASELERDLIKQRSQMGMKALALEHKWPNDRPPLGYRKTSDDRLEVISEEASLVRRIFHRYIELRSMPDVGEELNDQDIPTKDGSQWTPRAVSAILRNQIYIGEYDVAGVSDHVSEYKIIDKELFEKVTSVRTRFQQDEEASRSSMSESRKERVSDGMLDQYRSYLQKQSETTDDFLTD